MFYLKKCLQSQGHNGAVLCFPLICFILLASVLKSHIHFKLTFGEYYLITLAFYSQGFSFYVFILKWVFKFDFLSLLAFPNNNFNL